MKRIIKLIINLALKSLSFFVFKSRTKVFCFPTVSCGIMCVDIINYISDNTLSLVNYLLKHYDKNEKLTLYLVYYDKQRLQENINYVNSFQNKNIKIRFIYYRFYHKYKRQSFMEFCNYCFCFFQSKFIITSNATQRFLYKRNSQIYISLNYFTPFKLDELEIDTSTEIEYVISTSLLSSQIVSGSCKVPIENFRVLGFPRNDNILNPRYSREKLMEMMGVNYFVRKIIVYTPTHRDYESNSPNKRNNLGYEGNYDEFNKLLEAEQAILVIKNHPTQNMECLIGLDQSRIIVYETNYQYTLYDIFPYADVMITDYTSAYFDFLLTQRPVIFNFFDKGIYEAMRGFSYDPIEAVCAGIIVKNKDELFAAVKTCLENSGDTYKAHRNFVNTLMNKYHDSDSTKRVFDFFCEILTAK